MLSIYYYCYYSCGGLRTQVQTDKIEHKIETFERKESQEHKEEKSDLAELKAKVEEMSETITILTKLLLDDAVDGVEESFLSRNRRRLPSGGGGGTHTNNFDNLS